MNEPDTDWQAWYDRHGRALLLFARQFTSSLAEAEDAMHDGFIRFWKRREQVDEPLAYLYSAVRSAALDRRRAESRRETRELSRANADRPTPPEPWQHAAKDEAEQQLRDALISLPETQRELLVLKIWGGLTFNQIAATTDTPRSTAAARYNAALGALREAMSAEELTR